MTIDHKIGKKKFIKLRGVAIFSNTCQPVSLSVDYQPLASPDAKSRFNVF